VMEARRLGYSFAVVPAGPGGPGSHRVDGMEVFAAPDVRTALGALDLAGKTQRRSAPRP
jgi:hypothetical protein